jgi:glutamine amidotransferase
MTVGIIDYGIGNLGSIKNMLKKIGTEAEIITDPNRIESIDKVILPGVGSFDRGMEKIINIGFYEPLNRTVLVHRKPLLGICLGMQLFTERSEEGDRPGFGWIKGTTLRFGKQCTDDGLKIPHMGWNHVVTKNNHALFSGIEVDNQSRFYFCHSYYVHCSQEDSIIATTDYGLRFASSIGTYNILGVQFHPEKSHKYGMQLLKNYMEKC